MGTEDEEAPASASASAAGLKVTILNPKRFGASKGQEDGQVGKGNGQGFGDGARRLAERAEGSGMPDAKSAGGKEDKAGGMHHRHEQQQQHLAHHHSAPATGNRELQNRMEQPPPPPPPPAEPESEREGGVACSPTPSQPVASARFGSKWDMKVNPNTSTAPMPSAIATSGLGGSASKRQSVESSQLGSTRVPQTSSLPPHLVRDHTPKGAADFAQAKKSEARPSFTAGGVKRSGSAISIDPPHLSVLTKQPPPPPPPLGPGSGSGSVSAAALAAAKSVLASTPRQNSEDITPRRKRLGWGQGLARLSMTPAEPPSTGAASVNVKREHAAAAEEGDPAVGDARRISFSGENVQQVQVKQEPAGTADDPAAAEGDDQDGGRNGAAAMSTPEAKRERKLAMIKENQKHILNQVDDVDRSISQLEQSIANYKGQMNELSLAEQDLVKKKRVRLNLLDEQNRLLNQEISRQKAKSRRNAESEKFRESEKKKALKPLRPFVGLPVNRKEVVTKLCNENKGKATKSEAILVTAHTPSTAKVMTSNNVVNMDAVVSDILRKNCESNEKNSKHIVVHLRKKRDARLERETTQSLHYLKLREKWKRQLKEEREQQLQLQHGNNKSGRKSEQFGFAGNQNSLRSQSSSRFRSSLSSSGVARSEYEEMRIIHRLQAAEKMKTMISIPKMILDPQEKRWEKFINRNGFVEDPEGEMEGEKLANIWNATEKRIFLEKYSQFPKDFAKIASFLEHRSIGDCIVYYYKNQKSDEFTSIRRKHQLKKRRLYSEAKRLGSTSGSIFASQSGMNQSSTAQGDQSNQNQSNGRGDDSGKHHGKSGKHHAGGSRDGKDPPKSSSKHSKDGKKDGSKSGAATHKSGSSKKDSIKSGASKRPNEANAHGNPSGSIVESKWTEEEQQAFVQAIRKEGKDFKAIAAAIRTKSQAAAKAFYAKHRKRLRLDDLIDDYNKKHGYGASGKHGRSGGSAKSSRSNDSEEGSKPKSKKSKSIAGNKSGGDGSISKDAGAANPGRTQGFGAMGAPNANQLAAAASAAAQMAGLGTSGQMIPQMPGVDLHTSLPQAQQLFQLTLAGLAGHNFAAQAQALNCPPQQQQQAPPGASGSVGNTAQQQQPLLDAATLTTLQALLASAGFTLQPSNMPQGLGMTPQQIASMGAAVSAASAGAGAEPSATGSSNPATSVGTGGFPLGLQQGLLNQMNFHHVLAFQQQQLNSLSQRTAQQHQQQHPQGSSGKPANTSAHGGNAGDGPAPSTSELAVAPPAPVPSKRQISYWTQEEKDTFMSIFKVHGRDWNLLSEKIPGKTINQIKTFYQNYKQKLGLDKIVLPAGAIGPRKRVRKQQVTSADESNLKKQNTKSEKQVVPAPSIPSAATPQPKEEPGDAAKEEGNATGAAHSNDAVTGAGAAAGAAAGPTGETHPTGEDSAPATDAAPGEAAGEGSPADASADPAKQEDPEKEKPEPADG